MKIMNKLKLFLALIIAIFTLALISPINTMAEGEDISYYAVGDFNSFKEEEEYKLNKDSEFIYSIVLSLNKDNQLYISDKENKYKSEGLNKGTNILIPEDGSYNISFNLKPSDNNYITILKNEPKAYYIQGLNGFDLSDLNKLDYINTTTYTKEVVVNERALFYITDGDTIYDNDGANYLIDEGKYKLTFTINEGLHSLKVDKINEATDKYYILGSFNSYTEDSSSLMVENTSNLEFKEYIFYIDNLTTSQFYIEGMGKSFKNGVGNFILKANRSYRIAFSANHLYSNNSNVFIEELDYYILANINNYEINNGYRLTNTMAKKDYLEYSYNIRLNENDVIQFYIGDGYRLFKDNDNSYLIEGEGRYNILFSPDHLYNNDKSILIERSSDNKESFYVLGGFNDYKIEDSYKMSLNKDNKSFDEFIISLDLKKGDSFYIGNKYDSYYNPDGDEIIINKDGQYDISFSKSHDYGNGYNIYYKLNDHDEAIKREVEISTKDELISLINSFNMDSSSSLLTINLINDIDMGGITIKPIMIFRGVFNGNYHKLYNFKLDTTALGSELGFIRCLSLDGEVNALILDYDINLNNSDVALGGIAGSSSGVIKNSTVYGSISGRRVVGGIVGELKEGGLVKNSKSYARVSGNSFVGGIVGLNNGEIRESENHGAINDMAYSASDERRLINIGGITGFNRGYIYSAINYGVVGRARLGSFIGGISGNSIGLISSSKNLNKVSGRNYIGGISGYFSELEANKEIQGYDDIIAEIEDILNNRNDKNDEVITKDKKINSAIIYSYNLADIWGEGMVGGITGFASNTKDSLATKNLFSIEQCFNEGYIYSDTSYAGGIAGEHKIGIIKDSYSLGIIEAKGSYAGGIAGYSSGTIEAAFMIGSIKASEYLGGIAGYGKNINNTYTIVSLYEGEAHIGAIAGGVSDINSEDLYNNYYVNSIYNGIDNISYKGKAVSLKREELASKGILEVNLDNNHFIGGDSILSYPVLRKMSEGRLDNLISNDFKEHVIAATSFTALVTICDEDGSILAEIRVEYGSDLPLDKLPKLPTKEGYFTRYPKWFTGKNIIDDVVVEIEYIEAIKSISSNKSKKPTIIAEGEFYPTASLSIKESKKDYLGGSSKYQTVIGYNVEIIDDINPVNNDNIIINVKFDTNIKNPKIGIIRDGNLIIVDSRVNDDYIRFNLDGAGEFVILEEVFFNANNSDFIKLITYISLALGVVLVLGILISININKRNKNKKDSKQALVDNNEALEAIDNKEDIEATSKPDHKE